MDDKDMYQDHPSMVCTSKVFMGDNDNKKEVNKWFEVGNSTIWLLDWCLGLLEGLLQRWLQRLPMLLISLPWE